MKEKEVTIVNGMLQRMLNVCDGLELHNLA
jgi:hypothetical protein